jgi:peroxiredoxin
MIIRFDEADHRIPAPGFSLPSARGAAVSSSHFYERSSLVLLFLHGPDCAPCHVFLTHALERLEDYEAENAQLLAIFPSQSGSLQALDSLLRGEIQCLSDPERLVREDYLSLLAPDLVGPDEVMLFVLDTYGAPYVCLKGGEPEIHLHADLLGWLRYIGIQCPE